MFYYDDGVDMFMGTCQRFWQSYLVIICVVRCVLISFLEQWWEDLTAIIREVGKGSLDYYQNERLDCEIISCSEF